MLVMKRVAKWRNLKLRYEPRAWPRDTLTGGGGGGNGLAARFFSLIVLSGSFENKKRQRPRASGCSR